MKWDYKNLHVFLDVSTYCNAGCPQCHRTNPEGLGKELRDLHDKFNGPMSRPGKGLKKLKKWEEPQRKVELRFDDLLARRKIAAKLGIK